MKVACQACQTRFKIDDSLIPEDGKKVRCSRCSNVFMVYPEGNPQPNDDINDESNDESDMINEDTYQTNNDLSENTLLNESENNHSQNDTDTLENSETPAVETKSIRENSGNGARLFGFFIIIALACCLPLCQKLSIGSFVAGVVLIVAIFIYLPGSKDFLTGIWLRLDKLFMIGDWIQVDSKIEGKVNQMTWKKVTLETCEGNYVSIPNHQIMNAVIINYSFPNEKYNVSFKVNLDATYRPERVIKILLDAVLPLEGLTKHSEPDVIFDGFKRQDALYRIMLTIEDYATKNDLLESAWRRVWTLINRAGLDGSEPKDPATILEEIVIFQPFTTYAKSCISQQMQSRTFKKGQLIVKQGDEGDSLFIIEEGVISVVVDIDNNQKLEVGRIGAGSFFGEMALLTGEPRTANIIALTDTHLYEITKSDIAPLIEEQPEIFKPLSEVLVQRSLTTAYKKSKFKTTQENIHMLTAQVDNKIRSYFQVDL